MPGIKSLNAALNKPNPTGIRIIVQQHTIPITHIANAIGISINNQIQADNNAPVSLNPIPNIHVKIINPIMKPNIISHPFTLHLFMVSLICFL